MLYDKFENETYNLYTIETSKFKSVHMEVVFRTPATKENMTYLSLLSSILMENSSAYPSQKMLERKKCDLYNANIYATNTRVGKIILTNFVLDFLDPKYTSKEMLEESIKMLLEMILNPNVKDGEFDEETFNKIKRCVSSDIEALKEAPKQASILGAFKSLDSEDLRGLNANGDIEILNTITPKKLYKYYLDFLEKSARDIYVIGFVEGKTLDKIVKKYANFKSIPTMDNTIFLPQLKVKNSKDRVDKGNITQTQLVEIYSLGELTDDEINYALPLFNMLWGSGSLESKLYKSLRGENSLCYNVTTFYQKYDNVIILHTAIDEENTKLAKKLINNTLNQMNKGDFTDQELENAKNIMITSLNIVLDSPNRIVDNYLFKNLVGLPELEDRIDKIRELSRDDIIAVAKKLKLALTYRMRGE